MFPNHRGCRLHRSHTAKSHSFLVYLVDTSKAATSPSSDAPKNRKEWLHVEEESLPTQRNVETCSSAYLINSSCPDKEKNLCNGVTKVTSPHYPFVNLNRQAAHFLNVGQFLALIPRQDTCLLSNQIRKTLSLTAHCGVPSLHISKLGEPLFASTGPVFSILLHLSTVL